MWENHGGVSYTWIDNTQHHPGPTTEIMGDICHILCYIIVPEMVHSHLRCTLPKKGISPNSFPTNPRLLEKLILCRKLPYLPWLSWARHVFWGNFLKWRAIFGKPKIFFIKITYLCFLVTVTVFFLF